MRGKALFIVLVATGTPIGMAAQEGNAAGPKAVYELAPTGNLARFVVREQLAGATLPNDAIGSTSAISGQIVLDARGTLDPAASHIIVDLRTLQSDQQRRDNYIKRRTLVVDSFPHAVFRVTELAGFPSRWPAGGTLTFTVAGRFTVHGVTRDTRWEATALVRGDTLTGKAATRVKFGDFAMERPRVMVVLSVEDDIGLEFDFAFVKAPGENP